MDQCPNCGFEEDPSLNGRFAYKELREFTSGEKLAEAINAAGWNDFDVTPCWDNWVDGSNRTWRIQGFRDESGDYVIAVHNGKEWVAARWNGEYRYYGFSDVSGLRVRGPLASYHLKAFEPTE